MEVEAEVIRPLGGAVFGLQHARLQAVSGIRAYCFRHERRERIG